MERVQANTALQAATEGPAASYDIVIHSMGSAGAGLLRSLRNVSTLSDRELARRLLQAPAVVLEQLDLHTAEQVAGILARTGAEVSYKAHHEHIETGTGEFEIAATIIDYQNSDAAIKALSRLMALPVEQAARLLARTPAILINGVSAATVDTFREQLEPAGLALDISRPASALYDIYASNTDSHSLQRCRQLLQQQQIALDPTATGPLLATGVDYKSCQALWQACERSAAAIIILNQDYQRADVQLLAVSRSGALDHYLVHELQLPEKLLPQLYQKLPLVIARALPHQRQIDVLSQLHTLGAQAEARLTAFMQFGLTLPNSTRAQQVAPLFQLIAGQDAAQCQQALLKQPGMMPGPYNAQQARWLQAELKKVGIHARLLPGAMP